MKTAVEWLIEQLGIEGIVQLQEEFDQAKEMEKEQIENAYDEGDNNGANRIYYNSDRDDKSAEQYYNETFKQQEQCTGEI